MEEQEKEEEEEEGRQPVHDARPWHGLKYAWRVEVWDEGG